MHGTSSEKDSNQIEIEGFNATEGRATVSADLIYALDWATEQERRKSSQSPTETSPTEQGRIVVLKVPEGYKVNYATHTNVEINDAEKEITGYPKKFASGRRQLGIYKIHPDVEKKLNIAKDNILLSIVPSKELRSILESLRESIKKLKTINIEDVVEKVCYVIRDEKGNYINTTEDVRGIISSLVNSTIETEIMNQVRNLALDVQRVKGYKIYNRPERIPVEKEVTKEKMQEKLNTVNNLINTPDFTTGLPSVDKYLKVQLNKLLQDLESGNLK